MVILQFVVYGKHGSFNGFLNDENRRKEVALIYFAVYPMKSNTNWIRIQTPIYIFAVSGQTERFIKVIEPVLWGWEWRNGPLVS